MNSTYNHELINGETMIREKINHLKKTGYRVITSFMWILTAVLTGAALGFIGSFFYIGIDWATDMRKAHPEIMYLLPVGAVVVLLFYHLMDADNPGGTNLVISGVREDKHIPLRMVPLIFASTIFSHFCGASVGREGAALQLGGSVGDFFSKILRLNKNDRHIMILSGMSAAFSALLGTPLAAAVLAMEITSVGVMNYPAILPCVISALTARGIAIWLDIPAAKFSLGLIKSFGIIPAIQISVVGILSGFISILFIIAISKAEKYSSMFIKNKYLRAIILGSILLGLTFLFDLTPTSHGAYNGAGLDMLELAIRRNASWYDFLMKIVFTALSIAAGYKGGEIVPSFVIGATSGCLIGQFTGMDPGLAAAVGMVSVFCGVTNCPITALMFAFELFGFEAMPYFMLSIALSYVFSSYYSLYKTQHFHYGKFHGDNRNNIKNAI